MTELQRLGRALMLPIAVLPAAGLLLRLGQPDMLDIAFMAQAGGALFASLGLLFAIGVAVGFARDGHGAAGLSGTVCFLVATFGAKVFIEVPAEVISGVPDAYAAVLEADFKDNTIARLSVPIGILSGLVSGLLFNRFASIKLPEYLAFFGGKRFVPIAAACAGMLLAAIVGFSIEYLNDGVDWLSRQVIGAGGIGLFVYGVLNRILIITGLHHILNNMAWFVVGDFNGVTGDLNRFFAGDPRAGGFMTGFFPVMMFGLPAACFAMYRAARPDRRAEVGGMLGSLALTSFLTGVTEPIEFLFMFLAPALYVIHALLTGLSMALMSLLGVKLGFGFSAGLFDYLINFSIASRPLLLVPVGAVYAILYYVLFSFAIRKFNLMTPGRDAVAVEASRPEFEDDQGEAVAYLTALGGAANLRTISACTTRLRLGIVDTELVDEAAVRRLGAKGLIRPSAGTLQVIIGPQAEHLADRMRAVADDDPRATKPDIVATATAGGSDIDVLALSAGLQDAFGGADNIKSGKLYAGCRLLVELVDSGKVSEADLTSLGTYSFAGSGNRDDALHLLIRKPSLLGQQAAGDQQKLKKLSGLI